MGMVLVFGQEFALENPRIIDLKSVYMCHNSMPLGRPLLTIVTVYCTVTFKGSQGEDGRWWIILDRDERERHEETRMKRLRHEYPGHGSNNTYSAMAGPVSWRYDGPPTCLRVFLYT
jgi:hypothetical protein